MTVGDGALEATRPLRALRGHRDAAPADGAAVRQAWLIAAVCGFFGLSVLMLVIVLDTSRPVDRIAGPTALPPPAATTTSPVPAARPVPPAARPEPTARRTARNDDDEPAPRDQARELAERFVPEFAAGLPGMPGR